LTAERKDLCIYTVGGDLWDTNISIISSMDNWKLNTMRM
jgi:hypothetical protein